MTHDVGTGDGAFIEKVKSEEADRDSQPSSYHIITYPADYPLEALASKLESGSIVIPEYQRRFVWSMKQSSRLIESFLLGLPVPAVFLYTEPSTGKLLVVDGQQRLLSIVYYFTGFFGPERRGRRRVFKLEGLNEKSPYLGRSYADLLDNDEPALNALNNSVLRAFVIKQLSPDDDGTCVFHIFERLNTGGTQLVGQEIRNCVYHGPFNDMLIELNVLPEWRAVLGRAEEDKRQRDVELILRFFALSDGAAVYKKPMKDFLSGYMKDHQYNENDLDRYKALFVDTTRAVIETLGEQPFRRKAGLNAAMFDAVYTAFGKHLGRIPADIQSRYRALVQRQDFRTLVSSSTTDELVVRNRLALAEQMLFGE